MSVDHYENFPVASVLLPKHLREPIKHIYWFSRSADDIADESAVVIADDDKDVETVGDEADEFGDIELEEGMSIETAEEYQTEDEGKEA